MVLTPRPSPLPATKPRIAHIAGSNATITNSPVLVTSNKAREKRGLPLLKDESGARMRFDALRPQRLAAPVTLYVEQFSAHPLERDAAELYGPPDGYVDRAGVFHRERHSSSDVPVYEVTLRPEDGLYPLPYMAVQADGRAWDDDCATPNAPAHLARQPFYPDGARLFEEIDRLGVGDKGLNNLISRRAEIDFHRAAPPAGYTKADPPEVLGEDFFPYRPYHLEASPPRPALASITNTVQRIVSSGKYAGAIWTQGSPRIEETAYWLNLLIDTSLPICANASQRVHGMIGNDGDKNLVDSTEYICSRAWADDSGRNRLGVVLVQDQRIFSARDVQKADARPGGFTVTGGHGGILGAVGHEGAPTLTYVPARRHTYLSEVNRSRLPDTVIGLGGKPVRIKNEAGELLGGAIPKVAILKDANYGAERASESGEDEVDLAALIERNLGRYPLSGFVLEGHAPYGTTPSAKRKRMLRAAVNHGMPVVLVGRGNNEGFTGPKGLFIGGSNLTATKARLLLMACLMRFGTLPAPVDPAHPTEAEARARSDMLARYQNVFDSH
ncbi:MAG TPA: asparaginase domain-containing protein [Burkholderiales bacterium]|nr:asparaginase domain-containing protein [Burkholderiales bacterium]